MRELCEGNRRSVSELEEEWTRVIAEAERRAQAVGRGDVVDYLRLRAVNDLARTTGVEWLLSAFMSLAGEANRMGAGLALARDEAHRFRVGNSTMVGSRLTLRAGSIRSVTIEAGWPRAPGDGIVRGGGLASARIAHFGNPRAGCDLLLVRAGDGNAAPQWMLFEDNKVTRATFAEANARHHLARLLQ